MHRGGCACAAIAEHGARPSNSRAAPRPRARRRVGEVTPTRAAFVDIDREQVTEVMHGARAEDADGAASGARGAAP
jgi:hypothetical protein